MHLKSLDMTGFKSFVEARIDFPRGITGVVGPNGTGKSNVVDSILWVLGEQSTKTLRSERMEDVIFNGTEQRKPLGMAEVSLIISGLGDQQIQGIPPLPNPLSDYHEVMITRRLYRNGDSEYLINKTACRLKDIRSLLLETRAGIKGHTIIEQGRLDQILNSSPRDRRELIEETAGIIRYKKQRAEALRKLESTQQNLLRVRDVVTEVRRQLNSLERQAQQARRYQRLSQEAKTLEIRLLVREARRFMVDLGRIEGELGEFDAKESAQAAEQARLTSELEHVRLRMAGDQDSLNRIHEDLTRIEQDQAQALTATEVARSRLDLYRQQRTQTSEDLTRLTREQEQFDATLGELRERAAQRDGEIERAAQGLSTLEEQARTLADHRGTIQDKESHVRGEIIQSAVEVTNGENRVKQIRARSEELALTAGRLTAQQEDLEQLSGVAAEDLRGAADDRVVVEQRLGVAQEQREARAREIEEVERELHESRESLERRQEELAAAESRLATLEGVVREEMGYGRVDDESGTSLRACEGVREAIAEWISVPSGLERAAEAVLGERGRAWIIEEPGRAREAVELLKRKELGRGSFIPERPRSGMPGGAARLDSDLKGEPGVVGWALDLLSAPKAAQDALVCIFDNVLIVDSLDDALRLWNRNSWTGSDGPKLVTLAGEVVDASGTVTGGELESSGGILQRRREIEQIGVRREELAAEIEVHRRRRDELASKRDELVVLLEQSEAEIRAAEMQVVTLSKDVEERRRRIEEIANRLQEIGSERQGIEEERARLEAELLTGRDSLDASRQEQAVREAGLAELTTTLSVIEEKSTDVQSRLTQARLDVAARRTQREHEQGELERLLKEQDDRLVRLASLEQQDRELDVAEQHSRAERDRNDELAREFGQQIDRKRADYVLLQERQAEDQGRAQRLDTDLEAVRRALASCREGRMAVEVRRAEIKTQLATVEQTLGGTYQLTLESALEHEAQEGAQPTEEGKSEEDMFADLREQLQTVRGKLERMGPINLAAIEEHEALEERHSFLTTQEQDLSASIKSLKEIIQRINRTTKQMFMDTFNELQVKFGEVFSRFFPGGRAELILIEPEGLPESESASSDEPGSNDPGVDIVAQPPGKRLKSITMLSGGEKTLTAMALLFASFLIRPTPFCILDEIDAPLDDENIGRFTAVVRELSERAQFIVITHNKSTMAVADSLFGVTMQEPGVSQLLSLRLADLQPA